MALNLTQQDVNRSIFEAIRLVCVAEGYTPDIVTIGNNQSAWDAALKTIVTNKGFAIEIFGSSNQQAKGIKKVPRITIHPKRIIPGDIGLDVVQGTVRPHPTDPNKVIKFLPPHDLFVATFDIHLVSTGEAFQEVILNAIMMAALGTRKFIPLVENPPGNQIFFIQQTDFFETFDLLEGNQEKITSYLVPDLMLGVEVEQELSKINHIDVEINVNDNETETDTLSVE
jgi:hypothetical protein